MILPQRYASLLPSRAMVRRPDHVRVTPRLLAPPAFLPSAPSAASAMHTRLGLFLCFVFLSFHIICRSHWSFFRRRRRLWMHGCTGM